MPRDSIGRRVARAASIGGSKSYRSRTPVGWYAVVLLVCAVGLGLIVFSRQERVSRASSGSTTTSTSSTTTTTLPSSASPTVSDHWEVAMNLDICGKVVLLPKSTNLASGLTTPGNGIVDIQPSKAGANASQFVGGNSTVGKFLTSEGVSLTSTALTIPSSIKGVAGTYKSGDKCGSVPGQIQVAVWSQATGGQAFNVGGSAAQLPYRNGEMFVIGFVPHGTSLPLPKAQLLLIAFVKAHPSGTVVPSTSTPSSGSTTSTTSVAGGTTTTTAGGGTTTTTAGGGTTTTTTAVSGSSTTTPGG